MGIRRTLSVPVSVGTYWTATCMALLMIFYPAQPTFIAYFELATRPDGTALLSTTNGVFQTGGVIGTLTLYAALEVKTDSTTG